MIPTSETTCLVAHTTAAAALEPTLEPAHSIFSAARASRAVSVLGQANVGASGLGYGQIYPGLESWVGLRSSSEASSMGGELAAAAGATATS